MGFFKKLFKRKKGGSFVGNLIRKVAKNKTGGLLGNGAGLRRWERRQKAKEQKSISANIANDIRQQLELNSISRPVNNTPRQTMTRVSPRNTGVRKQKFNSHRPTPIIPQNNSVIDTIADFIAPAPTPIVPQAQQQTEPKKELTGGQKFTKWLSKFWYIPTSIVTLSVITILIVKGKKNNVQPSNNRRFGKRN